MKISYNWLTQYLSATPDAGQVAKYLTDCGLEVEGTEKYQSVKGGLDGFVIGEVVTKEKHPDADKLSLTTVNIGKEELLHIVCGAPNVAAGQKVVVATIGTTIYSEKGDFVIKKSKIRGEVSEGMICAEDELGLGVSRDGIMVLDADAKVGMPAKDYFKVEDDIVFEIGLTPNRIDAASHFGVARDLSAVLNCIGIKSEVKLPSIDGFSVDNDLRHIDVVIEDKEACTRYTGITISDIEVKDSPAWLQNKLKAIGLRPINNIVDITNFVLHETGQPLHAFDADEIKGNKVIIKKLPEGKKFITLDEQERELKKDDLMICNAEDGICIAGVFGGIKSGVHEKTKHVFLESACFESGHIRRTSKHHGLKTDASFRFERGSDPEITVFALKRAATMIREIAGGKISSEIVDVYPFPVLWTEIKISYANIDALIGKSIDHKTIKTILTALGIKIISENTEGLNISVPPFKVDVKREADVIEEILRIYGYNNVEVPESVRLSLNYGEKPDKDRMQNMVSDYLSNNGFYEIMCNSLTKSQYYLNSSIFDEKHGVRILNPLSKELDVMRQTLLFGGLETIAYNQNRKASDLKMYEFGNTYHYNANREGLKKYTEYAHLALFVSGRKQPESWYNQEEKSDIYLLKSFVDAVFKKAGIDISLFNAEPFENEIFSEGMQYKKNNEIIAELGMIGQQVLARSDIKQPVFYSDINWSFLMKHVKADNIKFRELPKFPEVRRDLALLLDKKISFAEIEKLAYATEKKYLRSVGLFDVYEGDKIEAGKKSYAVSFVLQDFETTLTDERIEKIMNKMMIAYSEKLGAIIR